MSNSELLRQETDSLLFASAPLPMWAYDPCTLRFLVVNQAAISAYGYSSNEFLAMTLEDIRLPEEVPSLRQNISFLLAQASARSLWQHRRKDGSLFWAEISGRAIHFEGKPARLVVAQDVTERKHSEKSLGQIMRGARCLIWHASVKDKGGEKQWHLKMTDEAAARRWLPIAVAPHQSFEEAWHCSTPSDDRERMTILFAIALREGWNSYTQEFRCMLADGSLHWLSEDVQIERVSPEEWSLVGVCTDVTARKRSEETLSRVMTGARCLIWDADVRDCNGKLSWNVKVVDEIAARRWLPIAISSGQSFDTAWHQAKPSEDRDRMRLQAREAIFSGQANYTQEYRTRLADGSLRWLAESVQIEQVGASEWRLVGVCLDITDRKQIEESLFQVMMGARCLIWYADIADKEGVLRWTLRFSDEVAARRWLPIAVAPDQPFDEAWMWAKSAEDKARMDLHSIHAIRSGQSHYAQEFQSRLGDGSLRWLAEDVQIEQVAPDQWRLVGVCTDITERKQMEAERERLLADALAQADRDPVTGLLNHRMFHKQLRDKSDSAVVSGQPLAVVLLDVDNFLYFNDTYGYAAGDIALRQIARTIQAALRPGDFLMHYGGDEFALILPDTPPQKAHAQIQIVQEAVAAMSARPVGAASAVPFHLTYGMAALPDDAPTRQDVLELASARLRRKKSGGEPDEYAERLRAQMGMTKDGFKMLDSLVTAVDNKDRYTRHHSEDVMRYCAQIACQFGLTPPARQTLEVAALLHDVGKIGIPDAILRKPDTLTDEEYEKIKQHPQMGAVMVGAVPGFEELLDAVRHHHERWDGKGYPFGLAGQEIPFSARIMAVADAFSAMTTYRPYRKGMPECKALAILKAGAGTQWDPNCVAAFLQAREP